MKELHERAQAVKRATVQHYAETLNNNVKSKAPSNLNNYERNLEAVGVKGNMQSEDVVGYAVWHDNSKSAVAAANLDPEVTLLYLNPPEKSPEKWKEVFQVLLRYEPFVMEAWPVNIPKDIAEVSYQRVSKLAVKEARERITRQMPAMIKDLSSTRVSFSRGDFQMISQDALLTQEGVMATVVRAEKGINQKPTPHWGPAIRQTASDQTLKAAQKKPMIQKAFHLDFQGWKTLGKMDLEIDSKELGDMTRFQEVIIGKT